MVIYGLTEKHEGLKVIFYAKKQENLINKTGHAISHSNTYSWAVSD